MMREYALYKGDTFIDVRNKRRISGKVRSKKRND